MSHFVYSVISLYLCVSVPTSLALKSTFVNLKYIQLFLRCPKARMHGAILAMTHHGGHFPNSTIPSSVFSYSVFRILLTPLHEWSREARVPVLSHPQVAPTAGPQLKDRGALSRLWGPIVWDVKVCSVCVWAGVGDSGGACLVCRCTGMFIVVFSVLLLFPLLASLPLLYVNACVVTVQYNSS